MMKALIFAVLMSMSLTACGEQTATIPSASAIEQIHSSARVICGALNSEVSRVAWKEPEFSHYLERKGNHEFVPMSVAVRCEDGSVHEFKFDAAYQQYETDYVD